MDHSAIQSALAKITELITERDFHNALLATTNLTESLINDRKAGNSFDPILNGWAYYYHYQALYEMGEARDAYDFFKNHIEKGPIAFTQANYAWMRSVAMELAWKLKLPLDEVLRHADACVQARLEAKDIHSAALTCLSICNILEKDGLVDHSGPYVKQGIRHALQTTDVNTHIHMLNHLLNYFAATNDPECRSMIQNDLTKLAAIPLDKITNPVSHAALKRLQEVRKNLA